MKTFDEIIAFLRGASSLVSTLGVSGGAFTAIAGGAKVADYFLQIAQAAVQAHETVTGKPIDLSTLHDITPVS